MHVLFRLRGGFGGLYYPHPAAPANNRPGTLRRKRASPGVSPLSTALPPKALGVVAPEAIIFHGRVYRLTDEAEPQANHHTEQQADQPAESQPDPPVPEPIAEVVAKGPWECEEPQRAPRPPERRGRGRPRKQPDPTVATLSAKVPRGTMVPPLALRAHLAGAAIGVSSSTMKGMISRGEVETVTIGRMRLVLMDSLRARLKAKAK
jgi:hypothetical protein